MMTFSPILMRIGYGLSWQNAVVAAWGGLRGAVGLALALQVYIDHPLIGGKVRHGTNFNTPAGLEKSPHTSVFTYHLRVRSTCFNSTFPTIVSFFTLEICLFYRQKAI